LLQGLFVARGALLMNWLVRLQLQLQLQLQIETEG
jgi:hypothetical protein